ncbi:MAG: hypothetical protein WCA07_04160 [Gloeobacterales cyanobacterium]
MIPRILLVDGKERGHYYRELCASLDAVWYKTTTPELLEQAQKVIDIALISDEYCSPFSSVICQLVQQNIPTLHIIDGIAEWRNTWENPRSLNEEAGAPLFQPILCHKIACLGRSQARLFEAWGNLGKCEVVGAPRFDQLVGLKPRQCKKDQLFRILVMTAKTPGFTDEQVKKVKESLLDLKTWFEFHSKEFGVVITPIWRVNPDLAEELELSSSITDLTGQELAVVLQEVDAVITTPSTAMLEAMLCGLPTALLDYTNSPKFISPIWSITSSSHIGPTISELVHPSPPKILHQNIILHDALECLTPATPRLIKLIETMVEIGRETRTKSIPLRFPTRILVDEQNGHHLPEEQFNLQTLYPNHPVFANMDTVVLQTEIIHLRKQIICLNDIITRLLKEGKLWKVWIALRYLKNHIA